jgi:uncharacterized membrane protein YidH (DUF202 family)
MKYFWVKYYPYFIDIWQYLAIIIIIAIIIAFILGAIFFL